MIRTDRKVPGVDLRGLPILAATSLLLACPG